MRTINKRFEIASPAILGVQRFPISTQRREDALVPYYLPIPEEVQVSSAPLQVDGIHGL